MKTIFPMLGIPIVLSLIMITSPVSAEMKFTNKDQISNLKEGQTLRPAIGGIDHGAPSRNWYDIAVERISRLRVDTVSISRFTISIDDNLKVSTLASDNMTARLTFGDPGIKVLPDSKRYNLGLGLTTLLRNGLTIDTSLNFAFTGSSDVAFWITIRPIRF